MLHHRLLPGVRNCKDILGGGDVGFMDCYFCDELLLGDKVRNGNMVIFIKRCRNSTVSA